MRNHEFTTTVATIAVKAEKYTKGTWTVDQCVEFAWASVNMTGDAAEDEIDFVRHMKAYMSEV